MEQYGEASEERLAAAEHKLERIGQRRALRYYDELGQLERSRLLDQVEQLNADEAVAALAEALSHTYSTDGLSPAEADSWEMLDERDREECAAIGWKLLREGKVAALVAAGGHGSRLGHPGPKGTFDIGLPSGKSLFQLQAERLLTLARLSGRFVPWYIMTSPDNDSETRAYFEANGLFGYDRGHLFFFQHGVMPAFDLEGNILLSGKGELCMAPSGNGECFAALQRSGGLADMKARGVEWLFYYNVDNALIRIADPRFVGFAARNGSPVATKAVMKAGPLEQVGIVCTQYGRPAVIEYSDAKTEQLYEKAADGSLAFGLGNVSIHMFRRDFVEQHADAPIPYHIARKKLPAIGDDGTIVVPDEPNAIKLERLIFDFFPLAESMTVLSMERDEEFAPVKNKEGSDSPESARTLLLRLHRRWLESAGVPSSLLEGREIEISPLISYAGEGLDQAALRRLGLPEAAVETNELE